MEQRRDKIVSLIILVLTLERINALAGHKAAASLSSSRMPGQQQAAQVQLFGQRLSLNSRLQGLLCLCPSGGASPIHSFIHSSNRLSDSWLFADSLTSQADWLGALLRTLEPGSNCCEPRGEVAPASVGAQISVSVTISVLNGAHSAC